MPRTKGAKNKPKKRKRIVYGNNLLGVERKPVKMISEDTITEALAKKADTIHKSPALTKLSILDREYLLGTLDVFSAAVETKIPVNFPDDAHGNMRYTPREMWENIKAYFTVTINYGQPLTRTGMAMFCGLDNTSVYKMRNNPKLHPDYEFIKLCSDFVEMYNEYAAHKKQNPAGPIFILKNMGWKDKLEIEASANQGALSEEERDAAQKRVQSFSENV